ncbi:MAG: efflux RND transporter periplasmic adaptor subunit [Candidatus Eisenbacteria bacterium]|nr:efflux RND transporter periplasmic adaptor subunit [Candidatus Eisenbacteria bacterium]
MNVRTSVSSDVARPPAARVLAAALLIGLLVVTGCGGRPGAGGDAHEAPAAGGHADGPAGEHTDEHGHDEHGAEGVVELTAAAARNAHLRVAAAGPATIATLVEAPGEIHLNAERVLEIRPRFPGVVRELRKRVGDAVRAGEVVAVVQSNESLTDYEVISSMTGTVLARPAVTGSAVSHESSLMTLADLSTVWADFAIYPQWVGRIRAGLEATIVAQNRPDLSARGTIRYVGPLLEQDTRVSSARVVLDNPHGAWTPGLFVTARVAVDRARAAVAVPDEALVRMPDGPAVFVAEGLRFEVRPVTTGRSDGRLTEILTGLAAGDSVVVANAFVLRSELSKGEAGHEH